MSTGGALTPNLIFLFSLTFCQLSFLIFLCLSIYMIIISIVRVFGFIIKNTFDLMWVLFWPYAEGAVAITMVSITAFQSLSGIKAMKTREKNDREKYWFSYRRKLPGRYFKKAIQDECAFDQLPSIAGVKLTGMRTFQVVGIEDKP